MRHLLLVLLFPLSAYADTLLWDFSQLTDLASGDLVYNQHLEVLHPSLNIVEPTGAMTTAIDFSVGDGSHGEFNRSTYLNFDSDGDVTGNVIVIDALQFPTLKFTNFTLQSGWTLYSINGPLVINALGDVVIEGTINCSGAAGGNAVGTTAGLGGEARCGGANGGDGGATNSDGLDGEDIDSNVTGGKGGNNGGVAVAGGGGGSWNTGPGNSSTAGANSNPSGGQAGAMLTDPLFSIRGGGAGGGSGSGTPTEAGAGGGAGGGQVIINVVGNFTLGSATNNTIGFILANGGAGGDSNVPGGAGGGGAGGSISVYSAGRVEILNTNGSGASQAAKGLGGSNSLAANGGNGGTGRSWYPTQDFSFVGFYTPAEESPVDTLTADVNFSPNQQSAESQIYDLLNTRVSINSITVSPNSSDFSVQLAGSDDNFLNDDTGFTSDLTLLERKRYIKIRASITTSNVNNPDKMNSILIDYSPGNAEEFDFTATSCARVDIPPNSSGGPWFFLLPFILILYLSRKKQLETDPY